MDDLMTKIQEAGEARQERDKAIDEAEELQGQIERLTKERDEAQAKAEDLQEQIDTDAREFEGECWGGLSQLLDECGYQWTPGDSVTVTNAVDYIREALQDKDRWTAKAEKERDEARGALQWRPIETAPRDGTPILGWHRVHLCPIAIWFNPKGFCFKGQRLFWMEKTYTHAWPDDAFSHWSPLPAAPDPANG